MTYSSLFTRILLVSSLAVVGCAAQTAQSADDSENVDENGNELSKIDPHLVGAYQPSKGESWEFGHLVLKADGTYFAETQIECFAAPCIDPREEGTWRSTDYTKKSTGYVTLRPTGHASRRYDVSLASDGSGMKLTRKGVTARFDAELNWCNETTDCAGQRVHALGLMCMVGSSYHTVCDGGSHACLTKCITDAPCKVTRCGVGCEDHDVVCTMMITESTRTCYKNVGVCGRDESGQCAWLDQPKIDACIADASK